MLYQQGDVLIETAAIPNEAKSRESLVLADGEATGHRHVAKGDVQMLELGERLFMRVMSGDARVVHEEHNEISVPAGDYEVRRVQEYDHFAEEARNVMD